MANFTFANTTGTGAQTAVTVMDADTWQNLGISREKPTIVFQLSAATTVDADLEGRIDSDMEWVVIKNYTADDVDEVTVMPEMRLNITTNGSGIVAKGF